MTMTNTPQALLNKRLGHETDGKHDLDTTCNISKREHICIRVFHDKIKFYISSQNLHQTCFNDFSKCEMVHKLLRPIWISIQP